MRHTRRGYRVYSSYDDSPVSKFMLDLDAVRAWALADGLPASFVDGLIETGWCPTALVRKRMEGGAI